MEHELINLKEYCFHYKVESSFIHELEEMGLISVFKQEEERFISMDSLKELESYSRMHYDLEINTAGIDAIKNLLNKIEVLENEMCNLRNRLNLYE